MYGEVPAAVQQLSPRRIEDISHPCRRGHEDITDGRDLPVHSWIAPRQLLRHIFGEAAHDVVIERRGDQKAELDGVRLRRPAGGLRLACGGRFNQTFSLSGTVRSVGRHSPVCMSTHPVRADARPVAVVDGARGAVAGGGRRLVSRGI